MVMKAKSKVRRAARFAPVLASLTALAMVAACARSNNNKAQISQQTLDQISAKGVSLAFPDYNATAPANIEFAKQLQGASIKIEDRDAEKVKAKISILIANKDPIVVEGILPAGSGTKVIDMTQVDGTNDATIKVQATCSGSDCLGVAAKVILMQEDTGAAAAPAASDASTADSAVAHLNASAKATTAKKKEAAAAAAVQPATAQAAAPASPAPDAVGADAVTPPSSSQTAAASSDAPAATDVPAETTPATTTATAPAKNMKPAAENVLYFSITEKAAAKGETAEAKLKRYSQMSLTKSGPTDAAQKTGLTKSYEEAAKARGIQVPADDQDSSTTAADAASKPQASAAQPAAQTTAQQSTAAAAQPAAQATTQQSTAAAAQPAASTQQQAAAQPAAAAAQPAAAAAADGTTK